MAASNTNRIFVWRGSGASGASLETRFEGSQYRRGNASRSDIVSDPRRFFWNDSSNWFTVETVFEVPQGGGSTDSPEYILSADGKTLYDPVSGVSLTSTPPEFGPTEQGPNDENDNSYSVYVQASRIPSGGDVVIFKNYTINDTEYPLSPCILGGFADSENRWVNGTGTGSDITGNLKSLLVESDYSRGQGEDEYPGYALGTWFGGGSSPILIDGEYWEGLYIRSDYTTSEANHRPVSLQELHGINLNMFGSASHSIKGISLASCVNEMENLVFMSEDFLREVHPDIGYDFVRFYYMSGNITDVYDYTPKRLDNSTTVNDINTGGVTLGTLNFGPNIVQREADGLFYKLKCETVNVFPCRYISPISSSLYRCYPGFFNDIRIENLNITDRNDKYDQDGDPRVAIFSGTIDNLIMDGGSFNIGGNIAGNVNGPADVKITNTVVKKGEINLITNDRLNQDIEAGVSGATTPFTGILSYDKNSSVSFPSGSLIKTFAGSSGASGGETGGGVENTISTSNKPIRELLSNKLDYLDLTESGA